MGLQEPTPPYEEGGYSARRQGNYSEVLQNEPDDLELGGASSTHAHRHGEHTQIPSTSVITTPHEHCESCERTIARREEKQKHMHCCRMVTLVFIIAFICLTVLGIVIAGASREHREHRD